MDSADNAVRGFHFLRTQLFRGRQDARHAEARLQRLLPDDVRQPRRQLLPVLRHRAQVPRRAEGDARVDMLAGIGGSAPMDLDVAVHEDDAQQLRRAGAAQQRSRRRLSEDVRRRRRRNAAQHRRQTTFLRRRTSQRGGRRHTAAARA